MIGIIKEKLTGDYLDVDGEERAESMHGYMGNTATIQEREMKIRQVSSFKLDRRGHNGKDSLEVRESGFTN